MSTAEAKYKVVVLKRRYVTFRAVEIFLLSLGAGLLTWAFLSFLSSSLMAKIAVPIAVACVVVVQRIIRYQLFQLNDNHFVSYLNTHYLQLQASADLLLQEKNSLTGLQQLQWQRTSEKFDALYPEIKLPHSIKQSAAIFVLCALLGFALVSFTNKSDLSASDKSIDVTTINKNKSEIAASVTNLTIPIVPPLYTGLKPFQSNSPNVIAPEGSTMTWLVKFSDTVSNAKLLLSGKDSLVFRSDKGEYVLAMKLSDAGFYQLQWTSNNKISRSDYYKLEVIKDQVPKVTVDNLNQFTRLSANAQPVVEVRSTLADDYGLTDAVIIATVSKGSGEGIKFREERLRFERPSSISGKQVSAFLKMDLMKMGMEPGDELYFYVGAYDNKAPVPNYNRTETFFVALDDTTKYAAVDDDGLGVDLMPEYFRSQRQLIIDTEKLLKEKKKISVQQFKSTSNELGYDQKVLRLRYGQFLGEEFEVQIGEVIAEEAEEESAEDIAKKFEHAHDKDNEHNLVADKKSEAQHAHEGNENDPDAKEDPLSAFAHNHDDGEVATFFMESVRTKLKAALAVMWDAELHLRLFEPAKSLPYQYTALKLLKEISNDSRIYVHRTGFDPPPLKEDKRLTAELKDVLNSTGTGNAMAVEVFPEIRKGLIVVERAIELHQSKFSETDKAQLHRAGQELATVAIDQPGKFLEALSLLKNIEDGGVEQKDMMKALLTVRSIFWNVLPKQPSSPSKKSGAVHPLDQECMKSLEQLKHD
jgi:hypothetical protein